MKVFLTVAIAITCSNFAADAQNVNDSASDHEQRTTFGSETGEYATMLSKLETIMLQYQQQWQRSLGGKPRTVFVPWIRDNVHVMKAMKFIHKDLSSFLEYFLQNQSPEGIYYDYYYPIGVRGISDRMHLFGPRYWKIIEEDSIQMHRLPVEADLEYLIN